MIGNHRHGRMINIWEKAYNTNWLILSDCNSEDPHAGSTPYLSVSTISSDPEFCVYLSSLEDLNVNIQTTLVSTINPEKRVLTTGTPDVTLRIKHLLSQEAQ